MNALSLKLIRLVIWLLRGLVRHQTTKELYQKMNALSLKLMELMIWQLLGLIRQQKILRQKRMR